MFRGKVVLMLKIEMLATTTCNCYEYDGSFA